MYLTRLVTRHLSHATLVGLPRLLRASLRSLRMCILHLFICIPSFIFIVSSPPTPSNVVAATAGGAGLSPVLAPLFIATDRKFFFELGGARVRLAWLGGRTLRAHQGHCTRPCPFDSNEEGHRGCVMANTCAAFPRLYSLLCCAGPRGPVCIKASPVSRIYSPPRPLSRMSKTDHGCLTSFRTALVARVWMVDWEFGTRGDESERSNID